MLTKEDLEQIGKLMGSKIAPIKQDMQGFKGDVQGLKQDVQDLKDGQARLDQMVSQDVEILGEFIVKITEYMDDHAARIKRLEKHTGLSHS